MNEIISFVAEYRFLSNFDTTPFVYQGKYLCNAHTVKSGEHAYQAAKALNVFMQQTILDLPRPAEAKKYGRKIPLRPDWEDVKDLVMEDVLLAKFSNPCLKEKLLATGDALLIEGNYWHDKYWGVCTCVHCQSQGRNKLGLLLMKVREKYEAT